MDARYDLVHIGHKTTKRTRYVSVLHESFDELMNPDLNHLRVFVKVAECGSFTTAANLLDMERSTLSRQVGALEAQLGVKLFHRSTRRVALTTAGQGLLAQVAGLMGRLDDAISGIPERAIEPSGVLRLTAPVDIGKWLLPLILPGFVARYPKIQPSVDLSNRIVDLEGDGFDLGLRISAKSMRDSNLVVRRLSRLRHRLYASNSLLAETGAIETAVDLRGKPAVVVRGWEFPAGTEGLVPKVESTDVALVLELVRVGLGFGFLPEFMAAEAVQRGELVSVLDDLDLGGATLFAVFPSSRVLPPKVVAFRDFLLKNSPTL